MVHAAVQKCAGCQLLLLLLYPPPQCHLSCEMQCILHGPLIPACKHENREAVLTALLLNALGFIQSFMLFWSKLGGFGIHSVYVAQAAQDYMDLSSSLLNTALSHRHMLTQVINEGF